jgi:hypothetical protein
MDTIRAMLARALAAVLLLAAGLSTDASAQSPIACDRACLRGFVDGYLTALAAHDPARLDIAAGRIGDYAPSRVVWENRNPAFSHRVANSRFGFVQKDWPL